MWGAARSRAQRWGGREHRGVRTAQTRTARPCSSSLSFATTRPSTRGLRRRSGAAKGRREWSRTAHTAPHVRPLFRRTDPHLRLAVAAPHFLGCIARQRLWPGHEPKRQNLMNNNCTNGQEDCQPKETAQSMGGGGQTCHERPAKNPVPVRNQPRTMCHSVIPAPHTSTAQ